MDKSRTSGEWERMVSGRLYMPVDPEIAKRHRVGMRRCDRFNRLPLWCAKTKQRALERLIPSAKGKNFEAFAPFYCEYGVNIYVGRNCFINYNSACSAHYAGGQCTHWTQCDAGHTQPSVYRRRTSLYRLPQRLPCVGVCRTHHHRGSLLAVRRCDGVRRRDHRSGQHHRRRRGGDTGHPTQQYRCRCTRQSAAADRRARPPACMGEVCEERTA